jgi:hypothetical protein
MNNKVSRFSSIHYMSIFYLQFLIRSRAAKFDIFIFSLGHEYLCIGFEVGVVDMRLVWGLLKVGLLHRIGPCLMWMSYCRLQIGLISLCMVFGPCRCLALLHLDKLGPQHWIWPCLMRFWYKLSVLWVCIFVFGRTVFHALKWWVMYVARPCYIIPPDFRSLMNVGLYDDLSIILLDFEV